MTIEIVTKEDLQAFRFQLLRDITQLLENRPIPVLQKELLRSHEVKKIFNITHATLKKLRQNGTLQSTKIGGRYYYNNKHILELLKTNPFTYE